MPDAEQLAGHFAEPDAEGDVVFGTGMGHQPRRVEALRRHDGRDRFGGDLRTRGAKRHGPGPGRRADALGDPPMPGIDIVEPFRQQHLRRHFQAVQQADTGCIGIGAVGVARAHVGDIEEGARQFGIRHHVHRVRRTGHDGKADGQHEALLRPGDGNIDTPFVHAEIHRRDGTHPVHEQHCRMVCGIQRATHRSDVRANAGGRFVVRGKNGLDAMLPVGAQACFISLDGKSIAPRFFDQLDIQAVTATHVDPAMAEHAVAGGKDRIAGAERVGDGGFPAAGAGRRKYEDLGRRTLDNLSHPGERRVQDLGKARRPVVQRRHVRRAAQHFRHVGRARYENGVLHVHRQTPSSTMLEA